MSSSSFVDNVVIPDPAATAKPTKAELKPKNLRSISARLLPATKIPAKVVGKIPKPRLIMPSRLHIPTFSGSGRPSFASPVDVDPSTPVLGVLRVRVHGARNLAPKDRNGKSDTFLRVRVGESRMDSECVKASINPIWGDPPRGINVTPDGRSQKVVQVDSPIFVGAVLDQRVEIIVWDKDRYTKNDYMGELSISVDDWLGRQMNDGGRPRVGWDNPDNQPNWYRVESGRSRCFVSGEILLKIGFIASSTPTSDNGLNVREGPHASLSPEEEANITEYLVDVWQQRRTSHSNPAQRVLSAPPTEGVGTFIIPEGLPPTERHANTEVNMPVPDDSDDDASDSGSGFEDEDEDDSVSDVDDDRIPQSQPAFSDLRVGSPPAMSEEESLNILGDAPVGKSKRGIPLPSFIRRSSSSGLAGPLSMSAHSSADASSEPGPIPSSGSSTGKSTPLSLPKVLGRRKSASELGTSGRKRRSTRRRRPGLKRAQESDYSFGANDDILGMCFVEVRSATSLPRWKNVTRLSYDMDPFVVISFGQKVFRTSVVRHSLNPKWDQRLWFQVGRHEGGHNITFSVYDWDRVSSNDFVGEVSLDLSDLLRRAPVPDDKTGLYKSEKGTLVGDYMHDYDLPIVASKSGELAEQKGSTLHLRLKFTPYAALRQQFWRKYLSQYDLDDNGTFTQIELWTMLDSLGSTLSRETILEFYSRFEKEPDDALTTDQAIMCLESEMFKPRAQRRQIDPSANNGTTSGWATPSRIGTPAPTPAPGQTFSPPDIGGSGGFALASHTLTAPQDVGLKGDPTIDPIAGADGSTVAQTMATNMLNNSSFSSYATEQSDDSESTPDNVERIINIRTCPLCHKPRMGQKSEVDIVTHLAICASQDWSAVGALVVSNFVTSSQAHRKWFTKVITKISNGTYQLGANSANIIVANRLTGQLQEEKISVYVRVGIRLLYKGLGAGRMESARIKRMLASMSVKQGKKFDSPESVADIAPFVQFHNLNLNEMLEPIGSFKSFNEFFYRKLKTEARPTADPEDENTLVSCADCRMMAFSTTDEATKIWIKGREFSIGRLLGDKFKDDAKRLEGGALAIFRLAPQDYHRFHSPVSGTIGQTSEISGQYFTVNPMAIRSAIDVYGENVRCIVPIDSPVFGRIVNACIGAMMVGSIILTVKPGDKVSRNQEYGYFAFGGSTIVTLFPPNTVKFDEDILANSRQSIETLVRVGMRVGRKVGT